MRIAMVTPVYPPYRGGIGHIAKEYTDRLIALGHTVEVFQPTVKIGNAGFFWPSFKGFDVVHLHYPFYGGAEPVALLRALKLAPPIVLSFHMDAIAPGWKGKIFDLHRRFKQPFVLQQASKILVSSMDYAEHSSLSTFHDKSKIIEMPFGVDSDHFSPGQGGARGGLIFVGGLDSAHIFKGLPILFEALPKLTGDWHLSIIGEGNLRASFEAEVAASSFADRVTFLGSVDDETKANAFRAASIHLFPSTTRAEAFGIVALEAGASGIPTIASNLPGVRTVVRDGETGLLVPPSDPNALAAAIQRLLDNGDERARLGAAARKRVEREYAWSILMQRLLDVYTSVV